MSTKKAKPRIHQNRYGNWYGYLGRRRVIAFANGPQFTQEQAAENWLAEQTAPQYPGRKTADALCSQGFIIDKCCYPWFAYQGPRFAPTAKASVLTELEATLLEALRAARETLIVHQPLSRARRMVDVAISCAEATR